MKNEIKRRLFDLWSEAIENGSLEILPEKDFHEVWIPDASMDAPLYYMYAGFCAAMDIMEYLQSDQSQG